VVLERILLCKGRAEGHRATPELTV